jgi:hypothetical protein
VNKHEMKALAQQAGEMARDLVTAVEHGKEKGLDLVELEADVREIYRCA